MVFAKHECEINSGEARSGSPQPHGRRTLIYSIKSLLKQLSIKVRNLFLRWPFLKFKNVFQIMAAINQAVMQKNPHPFLTDENTKIRIKAVVYHLGLCSKVLIARKVFKNFNQLSTTKIGRNLFIDFELILTPSRQPKDLIVQSLYFVWTTSSISGHCSCLLDSLEPVVTRVFLVFSIPSLDVPIPARITTTRSEQQHELMHKLFLHLELRSFTLTRSH